jgi:eukaryotic translation initiation factor 2C
LDPRAIRDLSRALSKLEISQTHRKDRKRTIQGVSPLPASETIETIKGQEISIAKYFSDRYGELRYPNLPLVNIGKKKKPTWVPIELCEVVPGQRCQNINEMDTAEIIKVANKKPHQRMNGILDQIKAASFDNDPFMDAFGLRIEPSMEELTARVLDTPEIQYSNVSERPKYGSWNLRDKKFVDPATVEKWGVINATNADRRTIENFIGELVKAAERCGMRFEDTRPVIIDADRRGGSQIEELMRDCVKEADRRGRSRPVQLVMVIKKDAGSTEYGDIKRMSDTVLGIPSQCVLLKNIRKPRPDYCANVALKINLKLSGKNSIVRDILPVVSSCPTIIIGADVSHPRSGMGSRPAIASVVASLDRYSAKYVARVAAQKAHNDEINSLPSMIRDLFLAFYRHTHRKPERIIYYRDGVSEGQFSDILNSEMTAIRTACKMMSEDYLPPVTFMIVNKRHHTRCFAKDQGDGDRSGNMFPGTVIDTKITDPNRYDFFLYGHSGIQGTSCPAHYTVLHDENKMSPDDIQKLTYNLCYTFSRCTRSVSVVPPVYYAHLAAARARFFLNETSDGTSTIGSGTSTWSDFEFADLHENIRDIMFFI